MRGSPRMHARREADMETGEALANVEARAVTYSFLSGMFLREVSQDFLERLAAEPPHLGGELEGFAVGLATADLSTVRRDAAAEFAALLLGMSADPVHPYESVYTSPERLMMQDARDEVLVLYRAAGLAKQESWKEGEDHIALELEFEQILCERAIAALEEGDEDACRALLLSQRNFLEDHLLAWYPMMAADLQKFPRTDFYKGLGKLTDGFLRNDREFLDAVLSEDEADASEDGEKAEVA